MWGILDLHESSFEAPFTFSSPEKHFTSTLEYGAAAM